jgi:hypothetical protein
VRGFGGASDPRIHVGKIAVDQRIGSQPDGDFVLLDCVVELPVAHQCGG